MPVVIRLSQPRVPGRRVWLREIQRGWASYKAQLVEEYCFIHGIQAPCRPSGPEFQIKFQAAVKFICMTLLQDLSPPWLTSRFHQAFPGYAVLCGYTKPSFRSWNRSIAEVVFGRRLMATWKYVARCVDFWVKGVVARPL